jgi:signal transduction histidine kinase
VSGRREDQGARPIRWKLRRLTIVVITVIVALAVTAMVGTRVTRGGIERRDRRTVPAYVALVEADAELGVLGRLAELPADEIDESDLADAEAAVGSLASAGARSSTADVAGAADALRDQSAAIAALVDAFQLAVRDEGQLPDDAQDLVGRARASTSAARAIVESELRADMAASLRTSRRFLGAQLALAAVAIAIVVWQLRRTARSIEAPLATLRRRIDDARDEQPSPAGDLPMEVRAPADAGQFGDILEVVELAEDFDRLTAAQTASRRRERELAERRQLLLDIGALTRQSSGKADDLVGVCEMLAEHLAADRCGLVASIDGRVWASWWQGATDDRGALDWLTERLLPEPIESLRFMLEGPASIPDLAADPVAAATGFDSAALGVRAMLTAPIMLGTTPVGVLGVTVNDEPRQWSDDDGALVRLVADQVAEAVAERQYVESLKELDRQKSEFLANASHELRTPLTSIAGYLEMLREGDFGPVSAEQEHVHEVIDRNAVRLRDMIEDILVLSRIEGDRLRPDRRVLDVRDLVERVRGDLAPTALRKGVDLVTEPGARPAEVIGDRDQLERAVTNVVANAVKFTPVGGEVVVTVDVGEDEVSIVCRDTGIGIPQEDLAMTGTKFFRARNAAEHVIPGSGIGLTIVRSILEAHGGRMTIESVEGEGTTVQLCLPLSTASG